MISEEMDSNAAQYSLHSAQLQLKAGRSFVDLVNVKPGQKVLDMGCGTGELTQFLAEQVRQDSEVVGVDPDEERIRLAAAGNLVNFPNVQNTII